MAGLLTSQPISAGLLSKTTQSTGSKGPTTIGGINLQPNMSTLIGGQTTLAQAKPGTPNIDPVSILKGIAQGTARSVASVGITAGNAPTQLVNNSPLVKSGLLATQDLPFDQSIPTTGNPVTSALFGGQPVQTIQKNVSDLQKTLEPYIGNTGSNIAATPLVLGSIALDLSGFGGGKAVELASDQIPEAFFKTMAAKSSPDEIEGILKSVGMNDEIAQTLAPQFAKANTAQEAKDVLSEFTNTSTEPSPATPSISPQGEPSGDQLAKSERSVQTFVDHTKTYTGKTMNAVDLSVQGTTEAQRVKSAIANSESIKNQIIQRGQEAYVAGRGLSTGDLALIRDAYQGGKSIEEIAAQFPQHPEVVTNYLNKLKDYYDFELAADRASGGHTVLENNHITQQWDLSNPVDLERFNKFATQRGLLPYNGYRAQPKVFKNYAEGISAGFKPKYASINEDLLQHSEGASHAISRQALKQGLEEAAPHHVSMSGVGVTEKGNPYVNSNIPGLEGISYHPTIAKMLQGYEPLKGTDFINLVKKTGAENAIRKSGIGGMIDKTISMMKAVPASAEEAGFTGIAASLYDHVSGPMKELLWNWSGFHSLNITLNHIGASVLHPITGTKGVLQSIGSTVSEHIYQAVQDSYKTMMVTDSTGATKSVFDWAMESGAYEGRGLPAKGLQKVNPFGVGTRAIFDREIPVLQLNLAEQMAKKGIPARSPQGIALGKEIRTITGEISSRRMNLNPNNIKVASRFFLSPGFTYSKYKTLLDSFTKFGEENGEAGNLARSAVIGKSAIVGVFVTLVTLLATGKFPHLAQLLQNFTANPSSQTNLTNPKGQKLDVTVPKTFLSELGGAVTDPVHYAEARLNPLLSDFVKVYSNKDYYGRPIVDPNVPQSATSQRIKNLGIGHLPIGAQAIINQLLGKQNSPTTALDIAGLGTKVNSNDPTMVKYSGIDGAIAAIKNVAPDDPNRLQKIQSIMNGIDPTQRKSVSYQELLAGVKLKGIYTSEVERQYFQVQDLLKQGDTAGANAITGAMTPRDYQTYKSIKTRLAHEAVFSQVQSLVKAGRSADANAITGAMTKEEYQSYQTWKKNNP